MRLKPVLRTTTSFSALTLLVGSFDRKKTVPEMTYNVFSGTLNPAQSINNAAASFTNWDGIHKIIHVSRKHHAQSNLHFVITKFTPTEYKDSI